MYAVNTYLITASFEIYVRIIYNEIEKKVQKKYLSYKNIV